MTTSHNDLAVLDTNVLLFLIRNNQIGREIERRYSLTTRKERPIIPTIVIGETYAMARRFKWGRAKVETMNELLHNLVQIDIGSAEIINAYAEIYNDARSSGQPCENNENDIWIAAATKAISGELYTTDGDFNWMNPDHINLVHISIEEMKEGS